MPTRHRCPNLVMKKADRGRVNLLCFSKKPCACESVFLIYPASLPILSLYAYHRGWSNYTIIHLF